METNIDDIQPMEQIIYSVYARVENDKVTRIFSDCFEKPLDTDILIKSGSGDEFVHVGYYEIFNSDFTHRYTIKNSELVECTDDEIAAEKETFNVTLTPTQLDTIEAQVMYTALMTDTLLVEE